jgi:hypothetical protein
MKLKDAIDVVNRTRRAERDPALVLHAVCAKCHEEFAILPQDAGLAESMGNEKLCAFCRRERRRASRRVGGK